MSHEWIGRWVRVSARSQKGKNRINEHGVIWKIKKVWGNKILIETDNGGLRWVNGPDDNDFEWCFAEVEEI